ncbi:hypothetical protein PINS_up012913 [Pythium insidiosum]|nr:hypothetical protein PINS_up012913 [Pythium insidiosum]
MQWMYEIGILRMPPVINLLDTPASRLFRKRRYHRRFMRWIRTNFLTFSLINRVCVIVLFVMWGMPASISRIATPIASFGVFPIVALSILLMSYDVLRLLVRQHEFWFFTFSNALNWSIAAVLFNDSRIVGCFASFLLNEIVILMDANFRTVVSAVRSTVLWVPAICTIIAVCATKTVDIQAERFFLLIPKNNIDYTLANSFLNQNITLMILVIRKSLRRLHVLLPEFLEDRLIPCSVLRCDLVLQRMRPNDLLGRARFENFCAVAATAETDSLYELDVDSNSNASRGSRGQLFQQGSRGIFAPVSSSRSSRRTSISIRRHSTALFNSTLSEGRPRTIRASSLLATSINTTGRRAMGKRPIEQLARQQMRVVTPTLAFLDLRHTLIPRLTPTQPLNPVARIVLYLVGAAGLVLSAAAIVLPSPHDQHASGEQSKSHSVLGISTSLELAVVVVPALAFILSACFFLPFAASYQRDILLALTRNFEFLFASLQFTLGSLCLADMLRWDSRCLALLAWLMWFHWVLLWDALLPTIRQHFHFKKVYGVPLLITIQLGLVWVVYTLFFGAAEALDDRTITKFRWGELDFSIRTSTFLIGRASTILTWSLRIMWKAARSQEDELVVLRGYLEYHTPLELFPVPRRVAQHIAPMEADAFELQPSESSLREDASVPSARESSHTASFPTVMQRSQRARQRMWLRTKLKLLAVTRKPPPVAVASGV